jgi:uncharacterized SAM-binding protein YcdF (DUF218 family)
VNSATIKIKSKGIKTSLNILVLFLLFPLALFMASAWEIWRYPAEITPPPSADYAIVLGAQSWGKEASPVFQGRIEEGIRLYRQGRIKKIIFSGGPGRPPQAEVAKAYAMAQHIAPEDILTEDRSRNTWENLQYSKELLPPSPVPSVYIVSDPLHLKRAAAMAQDLHLQGYPYPTQSSRIRSFTSQVAFWIRESLAFSYYRILRIFR